MEANSVEKFTLNHYRQRMAQKVMAYEQEVAELTVHKQILVQQRDEFQRTIEQKDLEISELHAQLTELRPAPEKESPEIPPGDSPEDDD